MAETMDTQATEPTAEPSEKKPLTYSEKQWLNVKKMSPKNRNRARNLRLRKMLFPKNAVMALNELLREDGDEVATFQVEACATHAVSRSYCAKLSTNGFIVEGYGDSKSDAKKAAAEQALKKIYLDRLTKLTKAEAEWQVIKEQRQKERQQRQKEWDERQKENEQRKKDGLEALDEAMETPEAPSDPNEPHEGDEDGEGAAKDGQREKDPVTLPMVQLASLALYKLYSAWEKQGVVIPNFHTAEKKTAKGRKEKKEKAKAKKAAKRRQLPLNSSALHPGFLLYYMVPGIEYKDLAIEGQKNQQYTFVVSVDAEGKTFVGKAASKKEARRQAALAACVDLFQVKFDEIPSSNHPVWAEEDTDPKKAKKPTPME